MTLRPDTPNPKPRRFYKTVELACEDGGYAMTLDGRTARTPAGGRLIAPTRVLAEAIGAEWKAQVGVVDLATMPLTRLAFTALDRTTSVHRAMALGVAKYAEADVICYFADAPQDLVSRQEALWSPLLDWARRSLELRFVRVYGIVHTPQPTETIARVAELAQALSVFELTGLAFAAALFHSAVLALAVKNGRLSGQEAIDLSRLEEAYQEARWGVDVEAAARTAGLRGDAVAVHRWFETLNAT